MVKRLLLLNLLVLLLVACNTETSSNPEDIRKEIWDLSVASFNDIDRYIKSESDSLNLDYKKSFEDEFREYFRNDKLSENEFTLIDSISDMYVMISAYHEVYDEFDLTVIDEHFSFNSRYENANEIINN